MADDLNMIDKLQGLVEEKKKKEEAEAKGEKAEKAGECCGGHDHGDHDHDAKDTDVPNEEGEYVYFDGGIKKKIIREGTGAKPPQGSKVKVHYTGTLESDGSKFDSSRDRNEPFEFEIGKGSVIKAWDEGVATMKVGERAILTCREDFAYGKSGSPPKIPGGATLVFDVDLLSFGENEKDISDGDGGIMKIVVRKGEGYQSPDDSGVCQVKYTGSANGKVFTTHDADKELELNIDTDLKMPDGLSKALQSMNKGEKSTFKVRSEYAYGTQGNKELNIAADTDVVYTIDMISFENEKQSWDMDTKEKIASMIKKKDKGNKFFAMRKYAKACDFYSKSHGVFSDHDMDSKEKKIEEEEKKEIKATQVSCHSNTALCKLKLKEFGDCIESCNKALEIEADHVKSIFRRGQAHAYNHANDLALADLKAAQKLKPEDKAIAKMVAVVRKRVQNAKKKEKNLYKGMFEKMTLAKGKNAGYADAEGDSSSSSSSSSESSDSSDSDEKDEGEPVDDKKDGVVKDEVPSEDKKDSPVQAADGETKKAKKKKVKKKKVVKKKVNKKSEDKKEEKTVEKTDEKTVETKQEKS